jgi:two-component system cell cycle sensor histidine kinase/response regulator CckA
MSSPPIAGFLVSDLSLSAREQSGARWNKRQKLQDAQETILVADDDAEVLRVVSGFLLKANYNVLIASSGKEAVQQSRDYKPEIHLLLSDLEMPGMSGIELATAISVDRPDINVLLTTGFTRGMLVLT